MGDTFYRGGLPAVLRELYVGHKTGLLHLVRGPAPSLREAPSGIEVDRRALRFRRGHIIQAQSNRPEEQLGATLVRMGRLGEAELEEVSTVVRQKRKRLGEVLQERGLIDQDRLEEALGLQVWELLRGVLAWTLGSYSFEEQDPERPVAGLTTLRLSTGELILKAARSVDDPALVRRALGNMERILVLSADPLLRFQRLSLTPADAYVVSRVDGTITARQVLALAPMPAEDAEASLFGLLCTGVIEFSGSPEGPRRAFLPGDSTPNVAIPEPPGGPQPHELLRRQILEAYAGLTTKNHFEVLGVPTTVSRDDLECAYQREARRFHPDAHHDPALADLQEKLVAIFVRLGEAYAALAEPRKRDRYERGLAGNRAADQPAAALPDASLWVRRGEQLIEEESYWEAAQVLEEVLPRVEGKARLRTQLLLAKAYLKNPRWIRDAEELLKSVAAGDPDNVEAYLLLGGIYKSAALRTRAAAMFRRALDVWPGHASALAELASLGFHDETR